MGLTIVCLSADVGQRAKLLRGPWSSVPWSAVVLLAYRFPAYRRRHRGPPQLLQSGRRAGVPRYDRRARRHAAYSAPNDSRLGDFDREILTKLRRVVPHLRVDYPIQSRAGLPGTPRDDRYGIIAYDYNGAHDESRSTSTQEVLPLIHALAGERVIQEVSPPYPGYPLVADARGSGLWFYAGLPPCSCWAGGSARPHRADAARWRWR